MKISKEKTTLRLTMRDLALMRWINRIGFVSMPHIVQWMKITSPTAYARVKKLTQHGYLQHERIFHRTPGIYHVSALGVRASGSELPPLRKVSLNSYRHDLLVLDLSFVLLAQYPGEFIYERELRQADGLYHFGESSHVSDGQLIYDNKRISIEVELSKKGKGRRERIIRHHLQNFDCQEVWYFCGNKEIENQLKPLVGSSPFIHIYPLKSFLPKEKSNG